MVSVSVSGTNFDILYHLSPYLLSITISLGIAVYAWLHRKVPGSQEFSVVAFSLATYTFLYIFELLTPTLEGKLFFDHLQWIPVFAISYALLGFAYGYSGKKMYKSTLIWSLLISIGLFFIVLMFTNPYHLLAYTKSWIVNGVPFSALYYDLTLTFWFVIVFTYIIMIWSLYVLLRNWVHTHQLYRTQVGIIIIGLLIPLLGSVISLLGIIPTFQRDTTPFTFTFSNLIIAWGLFRYRLFDIGTVARDRVIDQLQEGIFVLDFQGRVIDINPRMQEYIGKDQSWIIGKTAREVFAPWNHIVDRFRSVQDTTAEFDVIARGEQKYVEMLISPLTDKRGKLLGRLFIFHDITIRKKAEIELKQYRDHLEDLVSERTSELAEANKSLKEQIKQREKLEEQFRQSQKMEAVGRLAGGVAHDFNNLLTAIMGYAELMEFKIEGNEPALNNLAQIKGAADKASSLTQQLLAFSRKQMLQPKILDLNEIIRDMEKILRRLIGEDIKLQIRFDENLYRIKADPGQLHQVVLNLCVNARDAMPTGGKLTIETKNITIDKPDAGTQVSLNPGNYVLVTVSDTGHGMDKSIIENIFEPFFTTKETGKGTGLGLSTVHGIITQSGGHIEVRSQTGVGTTFELYFPASDTRSDTPETKNNDLADLHGTEALLLVEDDDMVRNLAVTILQQYNYNVHQAADAQWAIKFIKDKTCEIQLLITDIIMPGGMSGRELAQEITSMCPAIKVLYMSGYTEDAIIRHGLQDEQINFLQKPFAPKTLLEKVRFILDSRKDAPKQDKPV